MTKTDRLILRPIDPRTVRLDDTNFIEELNKDKEIVRLYKQHSDLEVNVGSIVKYKRVPYKVNIIVQGRSGNVISCYDLKCATLTTSSIFITPLLGLKRNELRWGTEFINTFLGTQRHPKCIAMLYRFSAKKEFLEFEYLLKSLPEFLECVDTDSYHSLYVFSVPQHMIESFDLLYTGRYSEIPDLTKLRILGFHGFDRDGQTGQILYKDIRLKNKLEEKFDIDLGDAELHSIPDMNYEVFNPEYYQIKTKLNG